MKKSISIILALVLIFALAACSNGGSISGTTNDAYLDTTASTYKGDSIRVAVPAGAFGLSALSLFNDKLYDISVEKDELAAVKQVENGGADVAFTSLSSASKLFNYTDGKAVLLAAVNLCPLNLVSTDGEIKSFADLEGKTVFISGEGNENEYLFDFILKNRGLDGKVTVEFMDSDEEISTKLVSGDVKTAVLSEPYVSVAVNANSNIKIITSLNNEWQRFATPAFAFGCIVVSKDFAANSKAVEQFILSLKDSVELANIKPENTLNAAAEKIIIPQSAISTDEKNAAENIAATVDRCNIVFLDGEDMKNAAEFVLNIFFEANADLIGGDMPSDDFYGESK